MSSIFQKGENLRDCEAAQLPVFFLPSFPAAVGMRKPISKKTMRRIPYTQSQGWTGPCNTSSRRPIISITMRSSFPRVQRRKDTFLWWQVCHCRKHYCHNYPFLRRKRRNGIQFKQCNKGKDVKVVDYDFCEWLFRNRWRLWHTWPVAKIHCEHKKSPGVWRVIIGDKLWRQNA